MSASINAFTMPKWGLEMQEGTVSEWLVEEGAAVSAGDALVAVETDKIANEVESDHAGVLRRIVVPAGETRPVGALLGLSSQRQSHFQDTLLAVIADADVDDAAVDEFVTERLGSADDTGAGAAGEADAGQRGAGKANGGDGQGAALTMDRDRASPKAQRIATELGIDLERVTGTGRHGRITLQDVEQAAKAAGAGSDAARPYRTVALTGRQKTAARRLVKAKQEIPHFYLRRRLELQPLVDHRARAGVDATLNDYLLRACALALGEVPAINAQLRGDELRRYHSANIAVAMQLDDGLITPVIKGCEKRDVAAIAQESARLLQAARDGTLELTDLEEASFSVSNLGMHGVDGFDAIVNPPAVAILAVGRAAPAPVVTADGSPGVATCVELTLSCDHRAVDGVLGARFLAALDDLLSSPEGL